MKRVLHIVLVLVAVAACQGPRIIPRGTLTDIYEDMFLADQLVRERNLPQPQMDTLLVYEAVFNKYGYNTDDYLNSVRHYLKDPERFAKIFDEVDRRLEAKVKELDRLIEYRQRLDEKRAETHPLLDSLLAAFSGDAVFRGLARVERDTSAYSAWFHLVPFQEDTLMIPVDSIEAREARKARLDSLRDNPPEKLTAVPAKPETLPRRMQDRPVEKELIKEEVEE